MSSDIEENRREFEAAVAERPKKEKNYEERCRNCVYCRNCWLYGNTICSKFVPWRDKNGEILNKKVGK